MPTWRIGDVIVVERPSHDRNRVVAWIIGPIVHMGSFYRVPIIVRTVHGAFAAHDELVLHHHRNITETDDAAPILPPSAASAGVSQPIVPVLVPAPSAIALPPIAPIATLEPPATNGAPTPTTSAFSPLNADGANSANSGSAAAAELANLRADNAALHDILAGLLTDTTELYAVEGHS